MNALRVQSLIGVFAFPFLLWAISLNRRQFPFRLGAWTLGIQCALGAVLLKTPLGTSFFKGCDGLSDRFTEIAIQAARVVFGPLAEAASLERAFGQGHSFIFAIWVGALITMISALVALLNHWNILPRLVETLARALRFSLGVSGSESLNAAANIFFGHTESVLVIKAYVQTLTKSELLSVQTMGMATLSLGAIPVYSKLGDGAGHIMTATLLSVFGGLWCSKILLPETQPSPTRAGAKLSPTRAAQSAVEAVCVGAEQGLFLALSVFAMLLAFTALVALLNLILVQFQSSAGIAAPWRLESLIGALHAPVAWLTGIPSAECLKVGELLGQRAVLNEFFGYLGLSDLRQTLSPRSFTIATYALSGFANPASVGMLAAAISNIAPDRLSEAAALGWRALLGGLCTSYLSAAIAGVLL
jgi:CNT family concentrative nucleoside transporter